MCPDNNLVLISCRAWARGHPGTAALFGVGGPADVATGSGLTTSLFLPPPPFSPSLAPPSDTADMAMWYQIGSGPATPQAKKRRTSGRGGGARQPTAPSLHPSAAAAAAAAAAAVETSWKNGPETRQGGRVRGGGRLQSQARPRLAWHVAARIFDPRSEGRDREHRRDVRRPSRRT
jgi:hypothetical protein